MSENEIPFYSLDAQHGQIREELLAAIGQTVSSNWFVLGARLEEFERAYAAFSGCRYSAGVANGLDALVLSLRALGVGPGAEVIVPAHTFIATWLAVTMVGARPVPVEPDKSTFNIDALKIEQAISSKTRAIIPVHLYGLPCDMTSILAIAKKHNLFIIEDNAQAHGATHKGKVAGSFGDINATSFYPTKNLGAMGDGGAITTNSADLDAEVRMLRNYGSNEKYVYKLAGVNSRLDEVQAAVLAIKLKCIVRWNTMRQAVASQYDNHLRDLSDVVLPMKGRDNEHVYHLYVILTPARDRLAGHLARKGIGSLVHYPVPPHLQEPYRELGYTKGTLPLTEEITRSCLSLPLWPGMPEDDVDRVCKAIREFF